MNVQAVSIEMMNVGVQTNKSIKKTDAKDNRDTFSSVLSKKQSQKETVSDNSVAMKKDLRVVSQQKEEVCKNIDESSSVITLSNQLKDNKMMDENEVIEALADILQKPAEEIQQILATLQIGVMDLLQMKNLQQLMLKVHNVDEPMDLLMIPTVSEKMKMISTMLEKFTAYSKDILQVQNQTGKFQNENMIEHSTNNTVSNVNNISRDPINETNESNDGKDVQSIHPERIIVDSKEKEELPSNEQQSNLNQSTTSEQFLYQLSSSIEQIFQVHSDGVAEITSEVVRGKTLEEPKVILDQIVERIKLSVSEEKSEVSIQLKPEHLGKLSMKIVTEQGVMTAQFTVENEKVKAMVEQNMQELRDVLENQGIAVQQLEVMVGQNEQEGRQLYEQSKSNRNVSKLINELMNENTQEEIIHEQSDDEYEENRVDFMA